MSNHVHIEPTKFVSLQSGKESLGVRVYSDEGSADGCYYDNSWGEIPENDLEVLKITLYGVSDPICMTLMSVNDEKQGLFIGEAWYDWVKVKPVFDAYYAADD